MYSHPQSGSLPRLLYVGDVPVESSYHGSALLYRLLQDYPPDKLLIVEAEPLRSLPERRLLGVQYRELRMDGTRLRNTRFSRFVGSWLTVRNQSASARRLHQLCGGFEPEAVLTVAHDYSWLAAARFAKEVNLPLHLIVHDDWPSMVSVLPQLKSRTERQFAKVYRQAASRLCVSPFMEEEYCRKHGVAGEVLYPSRAAQSRSPQIPRTYMKEAGALVGAYAGNIYHSGYVRLIASLAKCLENRGAQLLIFGPHSRESLKAFGLDRHNVVVQGLVSSKELISRLQNEADFVFVPMTFDSDGQQNMRFSFPSKLTDYTASGLPLLICGPSYCSAVRWAQANEPVSELVTSEVLSELDAALGRLEQQQHRRQLGQAAMDVGSRLFSHDVTVGIFYGALQRRRAAMDKPGILHGSISHSF